MEAPDRPGDHPTNIDPMARPPRRLRRRRPAGIGGVAGGIARYVGIDPNIVRLGFVVLAVTGSGLFIYLAAWLLLPDDSDPDPRPVSLTSNVAALVGGFLILALGSASFFDGALGPGDTIIVPAVLVAAGIWLLNQRTKPDHDTTVGGGPAGRSHGSWPPAGPDPTAAMAEPVAPAWPTVDADASITTPIDVSAGAGPTVAEPIESQTMESSRAPMSDGGPPPWDDDPIAHAWAIPRLPDEPPDPPGAGRAVTSLALACAAIAIGVFLVLANVGGIGISAALVLGTLLAIFGVGLVASAFVGRTPFLALLAVLTLGLLIVSPAVDVALEDGAGTQQVRVVSEDDLQPTYAIGTGELLLDLSDLELTEDRSIQVDVGAGYAEIQVPADVEIQVTARSRAGYVEAFDAIDEGLQSSIVHREPGAEPGAPVLMIDAEVTFGYIEVTRQG